MNRLAAVLIGGLGSQGEKGQDLVRTGVQEGAREGGAHRSGDPSQELSLDRLDGVFADLALALEATEVVDVHDHEHVHSGQRIPEVARPPLGRGIVAVGVLDQVVEVLPAEAPLDVAICAGGSTCWELAFLGVPAIAIGAV